MSTLNPADAGLSSDHGDHHGDHHELSFVKKLTNPQKYGLLQGIGKTNLKKS